MKKIIVILFGPPGCGKGTQGKKIAKKYGITTVSTGDLCRARAKINDSFGKGIASYIDNGHLVPDHLIIEIFRQALNENTSGNGYIFDGFPRNMAQYEVFQKFLEEEFSEAKVFYLCFSVPDEEIKDRISGRLQVEKRTDDNKNVVDTRLAEYREHTYPVMERVRFQPKSHIIYPPDKVRYPNAEDQIESVWKDIQTILDAVE